MAIEFQIQDITLDNIGEWPKPFKIAVCVLLAILIMAAGYWFAVRIEIDRMKELNAKQLELKQEFESKQGLAANLEAYKKQKKDLQAMFTQLLQQLPGTEEVASLLEDISEIGARSGLQFSLIKPKPEIKNDFYLELPIEIQVSGSYHHLGEFVSKLAHLKRIVTLHDFTIAYPETPLSNAKKGVMQDENTLIMNINASTYSYLADRPEEASQ